MMDTIVEKIIVLGSKRASRRRRQVSGTVGLGTPHSPNTRAVFRTQTKS
jgi:hypothetical protein